MESLRSACSDAAPSGTSDLNSGGGAGNIFRSAHGCRALIGLDLYEGLRGIQLTVRVLCCPFILRGSSSLWGIKEQNLTALLKEEELDLLHYEEFSEGSDLQDLMGPFEGHFTGMTFFVFVLGFPNLRRALASLGTLKRSCGWWMLGLYAAVGRRYLWHSQLVLPLMSHWCHGYHAAERQALVLLPLRTFEVV